MAMVGADSQQLIAGANRMRNAAAELDSHAIELSRTLGSVSWLGQIANNFVNMWNSGHKRNLGTTAKFIRDAADRLEAQANQQIAASGGNTSMHLPLDLRGVHPGRNFAGIFVTAKSDWHLIKGGVATAAFALWMAKHARVLSNLQADMKHVFHIASKDLLKFKWKGVSTLGRAVKVFGLLGVASSSAAFVKEFGAHHYGNAARKAIDVAWVGVGTVFPVVRWGKASFDGGYFVGGQFSHLQEKLFHTQAHTVDWAVKTYGSTNIGTRYSGWSGFKHWALDSVHVKN